MEKRSNVDTPHRVPTMPPIAYVEKLPSTLARGKSNVKCLLDLSHEWLAPSPRARGWRQTMYGGENALGTQGRGAVV